MNEEREAVAFTPRFAPRTRPLPIPQAGVFAPSAVCVTINEFWVSHLLGLLEVLDQPDAWQGSDIEIFNARQQVRELAAALRLGNCEAANMLIRQNVENPCLLETSADGIVWTTFADLSLCAAPAPPKPATRYDPVTGEFQESYDGGETWQDARDSDPRFVGTKQPITPDCDAANSIVGFAQNWVDAQVNEIDAGAALVGITAAALAIMATIFSFGVATPLIVAAVAAAMSLGAPAIQAAMTSAVWEDFRCLLHCTIADADEITEAHYDDIRAGLSDIATGAAYTMLWHFVTNAGPVGLQNAAAMNLSAGGIPNDCSDCDCADCDDVSYTFDDGMGGWQVNNGALALVTPNNAGWGVWTSGVLSTVQTGETSPLRSRGAWYVDLGEVCMIDAVTFNQRVLSGHTSIDLRVSVYDAAGIRVFNTDRISNAPSAWQGRNIAIGVAGRYVGIEISGQLGGTMQIDNVGIQRS